MKKSSLLLISSLMVVLSSGLSHAGQEMPPNHPKIELPSQSATHEQAGAISGKVLQTMNSGGYSYVFLQKKSGDKLWVAVPEGRITVGDQMSFKEGLVMTNFESKSLKRTFDRIVFSNGIVAPAAPAKPPVVQAKTPAPANAPKDLSVPPVNTGAGPKKGKKVVIGSGPAVVAKKKTSITKAKGSNAYTVEEVYKNSVKLNNKKVVVHGRVVKASTGIMKRTWIHIQDGTGSQAQGTHNLVCTTKGTANVGDVITVNGTLIKDRDFGYGYRYKVILEDAIITK